MPIRPCVSGCGRYLALGYGHDHCLSCLGIEHAEVAFVDDDRRGAADQAPLPAKGRGTCASAEI